MCSPTKRSRNRFSWSFLTSRSFLETVLMATSFLSCHYKVTFLGGRQIPLRDTSKEANSRTCKEHECFLLASKSPDESKFVVLTRYALIQVDLTLNQPHILWL